MRKRSPVPSLQLCAAAACLSLAPAIWAQVSPGPSSNQPTALFAVFSGPEPDAFLAKLSPAPPSTTASDSLPDAPSTVARDSGLVAVPQAGATAPGHKYPKASSPTDVAVLPGQIVPHQTVRDKLVGAVRNSVSPYSVSGELLSAGYSHLTDGSPNYGTNSIAFAQRFGASVARGTSQKLFTYGAMASILREDPRFYQMGSGHPVLRRVTYAATRPLITRTDSGKRTPNFALLSGYLGAAALTKVYYPQPNQGFSQTLQTYGGSVGGAALGFITSEFLSDTLEFLRLKKAD